jgi:dolichyl-phosphate beta-glucosyltransferase
MSTQLSVIVPAYNEEARIAPTLRSIASALARYGEPFEIIVVDDGSLDRTVETVDKLKLELPHLRRIVSDKNRGKGHAVRTGMLAARGRVRLMCDADGSIPANQIPKILDPVSSREVDVAIGSRYIDGAASRTAPPAWRYVWSRVANSIVRSTLLPGLKDTQCGFKAFSGEVAEAVFSRATIDGWAFDLEILTLVQRLGFRVAEIAVTWSDDHRTRVSPMRDLVQVTHDWAAIRKNLRRGAYRLPETRVSHG